MFPCSFSHNRKILVLIPFLVLVNFHSCYVEFWRQKTYTAEEPTSLLNISKFIAMSFL